jgi:hypothetical protein
VRVLLTIKHGYGVTVGDTHHAANERFCTGGVQANQQQASGECFEQHSYPPGSDFIEVRSMADMTLFRQYIDLADQMIANSTKDDIAETARLLAMNLAHYQSKFGDMPLEETLAVLNVDRPNESQLHLLVSGMENLVGVLGMVREGGPGKTACLTPHDSAYHRNASVAGWRRHQRDRTLAWAREPGDNASLR